MNNPKQKEEIIIKLKKIFESRFGKDLVNFAEEDFNKELLGSFWDLQPRDLLYLFTDIEESFKITIPQEEIAAGNFNTFNNIVEIIKNQLDMGKKESA